MPPSFQFEGQMRGEKVLLVAHQHPFSLLHQMLLACALLLVPVGIYDFMGVSTVLAESIPVCLILATAVVLRSWSIWSNSMLLLTNKRVLAVTQKGFLKREVAGSGLTHIHRVTNKVDGLLPSLLGYGSVTVYTDDAQSGLIMPALGDPFGIQQEILEAVSRAESGEELEPDTWGQLMEDEEDEDED